MRSPSGATSIVSIRVNRDERSVLQAAAERSRTTLSEFMRRKAVEAAEIEVLGRAIVTIPAQDWEAFEAWLKQPAEPNAGLAGLARRTPTWER